MHASLVGGSASTMAALLPALRPWGSGFGPPGRARGMDGGRKGGREREEDGWMDGMEQEGAEAGERERSECGGETERCGCAGVPPHCVRAWDRVRQDPIAGACVRARARLCLCVFVCVCVRARTRGRADGR